MMPSSIDLPAGVTKLSIGGMRMSGIRSVVHVVAFVLMSATAYAEDVKGWPGWKQESLDEAWEKALGRHNLPPDHPKPHPIAGPAPGAGGTECNPKTIGDPKVYDIALFPDQIKAKNKITDNADLNKPEMIENVAKTLTHELYHQCLRNAGVACTPGSGEELCEELAVDFATLNKLCDEVGEKRDEQCQLKKDADDPPTSEQQAEIDKLEAEIEALCKAIDEIRDKYNGGEDEDGDGEEGKIGEKWAEQLCMCAAAGWTTGTDECPEVKLPPVPDNPNPGSDMGGGECDYPDGGGDFEIMPECKKCDGCDCTSHTDPDDQ